MGVVRITRLGVADERSGSALEGCEVAHGPCVSFSVTQAGIFLFGGVCLLAWEDRAVGAGGRELRPTGCTRRRCSATHDRGIEDPSWTQRSV